MHLAELACPVCHEHLTATEKSVSCLNGHSFDVAKEGYVNLLSGKALTGMQGDSTDMVKARQAFLSSGHYQPLAAKVSQLVAAEHPKAIADFGCGEGYYLGQVKGHDGLSSARMYGSDISKSAIVTASRQYLGIQFMVADTNQFIPLRDNSIKVGLCIFAPRNPEEFARVLDSEGCLIVVIPGPNHLGNIRDKFGLIGIEQDKTDKLIQRLPQFRLQSREEVTIDMLLDRPSLANLLEMTPNARHSFFQPAQEAASAETLVHAEFEILVFRLS
jgi:23S rRNA (guanine745-N1)-methyltransferase